MTAHKGSINLGLGSTGHARAIDLVDEAATRRLGRALALHLGTGDVVLLSGPLGSGKTAFARAVIRALGRADEEVPSPTFTLVQTYDLENFTLWHVDLYRIQSPSEIDELGLDEALAEGVTIIEWPDRLGPHLPSDSLSIEFEFGSTPTARRAVLAGSENWAGRIVDVVAEFGA